MFNIETRLQLNMQISRSKLQFILLKNKCILLVQNDWASSRPFLTMKVFFSCLFVVKFYHWLSFIGNIKYQIYQSINSTIFYCLEKWKVFVTSGTSSNWNERLYGWWYKFTFVKMFTVQCWVVLGKVKQKSDKS